MPDNNASTLLEKNWEDVKSKMHQMWDKLSDADLKNIHNTDDLIQALKRVYKLNKEEALNKIHDFVEKHNLEPDLTRFEEFKDALFENIAEAKDKLGEKFTDSLSTLQDKSIAVKDNVKGYIKEHPLKALGLGLLATVAIKELLKLRKD